MFTTDTSVLLLFSVLVHFVLATKGQEYTTCHASILRSSKFSSGLRHASKVQEIWTIRPSSRKHNLRLRINSIQLPRSHSCTSDKLVIFAGYRIGNPTSVTYCGVMATMELLLLSDVVTIHFESLTLNRDILVNITVDCLPKDQLHPKLCRPEEFSCKPNFYKTIMEVDCLPMSRVCDGKRYCSKGEDEDNCEAVITSSETPAEVTTPTLTTEAWTQKPTTTEAWTQKPTTTEEWTQKPATTEAWTQKPTTTEEWTQKPTTTPTKMYSCVRSGLQIEYSSLCDGVKDCPHGDDELCSSVCPRDNFLCSGECADKQELLCDGVDDCEDASDETLCQPSCPGPERFLCHLSNATCVPAQLRCNGEKDCPMGEDEQHCNSSCSGLNEFLCKSESTCIPRRWMCDGVDDCFEGDDEKNCTNLYTTTRQPNTENLTTPEKPTLPIDKPTLPTETPTLPTETPTLTTETPTLTTEKPTLATSAVANRECPKDYGLCVAAQRCIPKVWFCDGFNDCPNSEDEREPFCGPKSSSFGPTSTEATSVVSGGCLVGERFCRKSELCIAERYFCDGKNQCYFGEDEANCP